MTLEDLYNKKEISEKTYNVCVDNNLLTLKEIKSFFREHSSFYGLDTCGLRTNEELISLCQNIFLTENELIDANTIKTKDINEFSLNHKNLENTEYEKDLTLNQLFEEKLISTRTFNACRRNGLTSAYKIKGYFIKNGNFLSFNNFGKKSNKELIDFCKNFNQKDKPKYKSIKTILDNLNIDQRRIINSFIKTSFEKLPVRSRNAISIHLQKNITLSYLADQFLLKENFSVSRMHNVGKKSIPEIEGFLDQVKSYIYSVNAIQDPNELKNLKNKILFGELFNNQEIPEHILESQLIFQIVDYTIDLGLVYDHTQCGIFKYLFKVYEHIAPMDLDGAAQLIDLSRERIRQRQNELFAQIEQNFSFIKSIDDDLLANYNINTSQLFILITKEEIKRVNEVNKTKFSRAFITFALSVFLNDDFVLLGEKDQVFFECKVRNTSGHIWNNFYVINKVIYHQIDFEAIVMDIDKRLQEKIDETYSFNIKSYIYKFSKNATMDIIEEALPVVEYLIIEEFDMYVDTEDNIQFKRNTIKKVYEYAYEALEALDEPSRVNDIYSKVMELYPKYNTSEDSLRAAMNRDNGFVPIGRQSVYGLQKWEEEREEFMGGTIRNIARKYLEKFDKPKHHHDVSDHVLKFRPKSNHKSIIYNLKLDESGTFEFYENQMIGLLSKEYNKTNDYE